MEQKIKEFIKEITSGCEVSKASICGDIENWSDFPVQETWDDAVKEGLIKKLDDHFWIWHEEYETSKKLIVRG